MKKRGVRQRRGRDGVLAGDEHGAEARSRPAGRRGAGSRARGCAACAGARSRVAPVVDGGRQPVDAAPARRRARAARGRTAPCARPASAATRGSASCGSRGTGAGRRPGRTARPGRSRRGRRPWRRRSAPRAAAPAPPSASAALTTSADSTNSSRRRPAAALRRGSSAKTMSGSSVVSGGSSAAVGGRAVADAEQQRRDVVDAAGRVRGAHQLARGVRERRRRAEDPRDLGVADHVVEAVGGEQEDVVLRAPRASTCRRPAPARCRRCA